MPTSVPPLATVQAAIGGRIRLDQEIRVGGQAVVFKGLRLRDAADNATEDEVAVKVYTDQTQDQRVEREIQTMTAIRHIALGNLLEHHILILGNSQYRCVVWEFVRGEALDHRLTRGPLSARTTAIIGRDVASALEAVWSKRVVHRDVNPKNIMLRAGDSGAVLIDLGVAKYIDQTPLTAPGLTWGTVGYYSPEQLMGVQLTCQSDVFSLGIALQQTLTGQHPTGFNQELLRNGGPATATVAPAAPAILAATIDRMVSARPAHRPTPNMLMEELGEVLRRL